MESFRIKMRKVATIVACFAVTTAFASCEPADEPALDAPAFAEFSFASQRGTADVDAKKRTVKAVAECGTNLAALAPAFKLSPEGATAAVDGKPQESGKTANNFADAVVYKLAAPDGTTAEWTVTITLPDDCPTLTDCERKIFNEIALAKMTSIGKTIPGVSVVARYNFTTNWGTEMAVYTVPDAQDIRPGVYVHYVRYVFFYCQDYYAKEKQLDEQRAGILDYDDAGLWYSMEQITEAKTYQDAYDEYNNSSMYEIVE